MRAILSPLVLTVGLALALPAGAQDLLIHGGPIYTGGAKVEAGAAGTIQTATTGLVLGIALTAAAAAGDIVEFVRA